MSTTTVDAIARRTAEAVSRRRSLVTLGGAALAASLSGSGITAAKGGGKGKDRCKQQVGKCRQGVADLCALIFAEDAAECEAFFSPCCRFLANCETAKAFACVAENIPA